MALPTPGLPLLTSLPGHPRFAGDPGAHPAAEHCPTPPWQGGDRGRGPGPVTRGRGPGPVTRGRAVRGATPRPAPRRAAALWRPLAAASGAGAERGNTAAGAALVLTPPARPPLRGAARDRDVSPLPGGRPPCCVPVLGRRGSGLIGWEGRRGASARPPLPVQPAGAARGRRGFGSCKTRSKRAS